MTCVGCNKNSFRGCEPRAGLPSCSGCFDQCPEHPFAPVIQFPEVEVSQALSLANILTHDRLISLTTEIYYEFNGCMFIHVGSGSFLEYTANPIFPLTGIFQFRFRKYPALGNQVRPDGTVPYQSAGYIIREGDFLMLENTGIGRVVGQVGYPSPVNAPFVNATVDDAVNGFDTFGTQSYQNVRIISDDFDPRLAPDDQPAVELNGTKVYYIQFTRTAQNLALYPGQWPAPCRLTTTAYLGDGARWRFFPISFHNPVLTVSYSPTDTVVVTNLPSDLEKVARINAAANQQIAEAQGNFAEPIPQGPNAATPAPAPGLTAGEVLNFMADKILK